MDYLEQVTEKHNGWFVDLFVRPSNKIAVGMYKALGKKGDHQSEKEQRQNIY